MDELPWSVPMSCTQAIVPTCLALHALPMKEIPAVELRLASEQDRAELLRMYAEQIRILHSFDASVVPDQVLEDDWWLKPEDLFPFMIYHEGEPVGFYLVFGSRYAAAVGAGGDHLIWEMFVGEAYRGSGVAERAVREILAIRPGRWFVQAMPKNGRAHGFWRRITLGPPYNGTEDLNDEGFATFRFVAP
ncbi:MAG: putative acetyltransferase [Planctomycetota bacterium]|jgi:predicted acetyltransferase